MTTQRRRQLCLLILMFGLAAPAAAIESWSAFADPSAVRAFAPDPEGGLWAASRGGLLRLEPGSVEPELIGTAEGLPGTDLVDVLLLNDEIWVATATEGLARYRPGDAQPWRRFQTLPQGLADDAMDCLAPGPDGALWYGTASGYGRIDVEDPSLHDIWTDLNGLANSHVLDLAWRGDTLLVATAGGLHRMDPGANPELVPGAPAGRIDFVVAAADSIWLLRDRELEGAILRGTLDGAAYASLPLPVTGLVARALAAAGDALYVALGELGGGGRGDRLFRYEPDAGWTDLGAGLPVDYLYPAYAGLDLRAIHAGSGDELWVGGVIAAGLGPGILHRAGGGWEQIPCDGFPLGSEVKVLRRGASGNIWCMGTVGGARHDDGGWRRYPSDPGFGYLPRFGLDVMEDGLGWVWFTRYGQNLGRISLLDGTEEIIAASGVKIIRMTEDGAGNRWFGLDGEGIDICLNDGADTWIRLDADDGLPGLVVDGVVPLAGSRMALLFRGVGPAVLDHRGTLDDSADDFWYQLGSGLVDENNYLQVDTQFSSLAPDGAGGFWVGQPTGLVRVRGLGGSYQARARLGAKSQFQDGLLAAAVTDVALAPDGAVWVATALGLGRVTLDISGQGNDEVLRWTVRNWTNEAGREAAGEDLFGQEILAPLPDAACTRLALSADGGTVWVGTLTGLARLELLPDPPGDSEAVLSAWVYPNPVRFSLGHSVLRLGGIDAPATVTVYNLEGQLVKEVGEVAPGEVAWDLETRFGNRAVSGMYIIKLEVEGVSALRRVAVVR